MKGNTYPVPDMNLSTPLPTFSDATSQLSHSKPQAFVPVCASPYEENSELKVLQSLVLALHTQPRDVLDGILPYLFIVILFLLLIIIIIITIINYYYYY